MRYNWQQPDWPQFRYQLASVEADLLAFADQAGQVSGLLRSLPEGTQTEAMLNFMISEAIKSSAIEGEYLSRQDVMSSIRNQLGLNKQPEQVRDEASEGAGELMVEVRNSWDEPLSEAVLFDWHRKLMQAARGIQIGQWRTHAEAMQVISGAVGKEKVHFEAPPSCRVSREMDSFFGWFNQSRQSIPYAPVRSAVAHLYFESIHPFEDGNGRIGRAISEKALSQGLNRPVLLSLSQTIETNKKAYYQTLEQAQQSREITPWIEYFVSMVLEAQTLAVKQIEFVLQKTRFFECYRKQLNQRQLRVIERMLEAGVEGFEGGMNARKYQSISQTSKATATRDLQDLASRGIFQPIGGGRSTRYELRL